MVGVTAVGVTDLSSKSSNVKRVSRSGIIFQADGAEAVIIKTMGKYFEDLLGSSDCGKVPVKNGAIG